MFHSIRSTPHAPAPLVLRVPTVAANDSAPVAATGLHPAPPYRGPRTGSCNRDIWSALPDIRSARDARRLQHRHCGLLCLAATGVLVMAACRLLLQ
ncbi:hypothetical protein ABFU27_18245 [Xanthomonas campestris pv. raphani]|uniref:hypothetical protein n=1 Tax=Xanthomonas campestris TaxID=339 RepID=UPI002B23E04D|nr:hypothetical protein [Xanthomonas campestris]MEA9707932.1 hypothetical protein [Xanthomonas campestris pv. raphani]MEA9860921.1 hypothetical protein [Xanthomonas campestris pv. raphani]MEA9901213.1 hypothetical protein [Xanthomonas campestris pv. raphani]MEA9941998.1 hypothetical protein [Xanthomonas campestris pv. raphani]